MGDDSSPPTDTDDVAEVDVEAAEASYNHRTDPVVPGGDFLYPIGKAVGFLGFAFLIGVVMEIGKRVGRDLHRSRL